MYDATQSGGTVDFGKPVAEDGGAAWQRPATEASWGMGAPWGMAAVWQSGAGGHAVRSGVGRGA